MGDVSLGGSKNTNEPQKEKVMHFNIGGLIVMMIELGDSSNIKKYRDPIIKTMKDTLSKKELRNIILKTFGVKTVKKLKKLKTAEYQLLTDMFGKDIWGI